MKKIRKLVACAVLMSMLTSTASPLAAGIDISADTADMTAASKADVSGNLEVDINFKMPIKNTSKEETKLKVLLRGSLSELEIDLGGDEAVYEKEAVIDGTAINYTVKKLNENRGLTTLDDTEVSYYNVVFSGLKQGEYSVEVSGKGFNNIVENNIKIEDYSKRLVLDNQKVMLFGDFDKNNVIDEEDYKDLLDNIETNDLGLIEKYDLNRDGIVDILDLHYVHENLSVVKSDAQIINTDAIIDPANVTFEAKSGQEVTGTSADLFKEEGKVQISSKDANDNDVDITPENPVELTMDLGKSTLMEQVVIKAPEGGSAPASGEVILYDENGAEECRADYGQAAVFARSNSRNSEGNITIDLGKQVAVKKITIVVKETTKDPKLAEIAKVEFLNNVYEEVPAPVLNIPSIKDIAPDHETLTVSWNHEPNVTGYEVRCVSLKDGNEYVRQTTSNSVEFKNLKNYEEYELTIKSLNGNWSSEFSKPVIGIPKPQERPTAPEGVNIEGLYKGLKVSWKENDMAVGQNLYYRKAGTEDYVEVKNIIGTSYTISGLEDETTYEVYLTAYNDVGVSNKSNVYSGKTLALNPPVSPDYKLINTANKEGELTNHIVDVNYPNVLDNDYSTYWHLDNWDAGVYSKRGPIITLDDEYTMDTIALIPRQEPGFTIPYRANIGVYDEESDSWDYIEVNIENRNNNGPYVLLKLDTPVTAKKIQVNPSVYGGEKVSISELKLYNYDSIENDIKNLFEDDLQVEIKENVDQDLIDELRERLNTPDDVSGEYHWNKDVLEKELNLAEDILNDKGLSECVYTVKQDLNYGTFNLGMTNDWQSLGLSVRAGEEIVVYVGTEGNIIPELIVTQHYGESSKFAKIISLKKGRNVIQIPEIHDLDVEKGGSIYVRYTNESPNNKPIKIRVSGGTKIPHLDVYDIINDESKADEVKDRVRTYIRELKDYTNNIEDMYPSFFTNKKDNVYKYDERTSVLNTTDIETKKVTLNLPATEILKGITSGLNSEDEQVERVYNTLLAWEQIMDITFAKKGVLGTDIQPRTRMNIKYQRMFGKAFMYASSKHVGIEFDSAAALMQGKPYIFNEDKTIEEDGSLFGWGIAHEIGHVVDKPLGTYSETTNNILSLMIQTFNDKNESRLESSGVYPKIYDKVTSGTISLPNDVFTLLGMFWQLHLAYEDNPTYEMLWNNDTYYGRLNKLYRDMPSDMKSLDKDQILVRLASDAAEKDLTDFFYKWGIRPTEETYEYIKCKGYEKEERQIQYLNDEARRQRLSGMTPMDSTTKVEAGFDGYSDGDYVRNSKDITLNLGTSGDSEKILGYEIYRNGVPVGFTTEDTYTDVLGAVNNRVFKYEVVAYDYLLNTTEKFEVGSVKISHDGSMKKDSWNAYTNTTNDEDVNNEMDPSGPIVNGAINKVIDNKKESVYVGYKDGNKDPEIVIAMNGVNPIAGIKYTTDDVTSASTIEGYEVYISKDGIEWTLANSGKFEFGTNGNDAETATVYFNEEDSEGGKQLYTYEAAYVKLVAKGKSVISVAEMDILAPPGDNIDIDAIGTLKENYEYAPGEIIEAGSIIITGEYRGNPAFNIPILKDDEGYVINSEAVLLAEIPSNAHLGEISSGRWISWIPKEEESSLTTKVMAKLYRVNDAVTLEGQRLVSDSLYFDIPSKLPEIELKKD